MHFHNPRDALDAGICMVHQHFRLVPPFTVAENVVLGDHRHEGNRFILNQRAIERRVVELGERYSLSVDPRARIWQLSVGEQQRVEILKALYRDARILILDEPTAVLTPQEADGLFETLRAMAAEGRTVIFISHKLNEVKAVADRVTVLRGGRSIATVDTADASPRELAALMVGRQVELAAPRRARGAARHRRRARGRGAAACAATAASDAVKGVSLSVRHGEIVGVAGVAGNGQRELAEAITGIRPPAPGAVRVDGRELRSSDPRSAIAAGVAHVPEDRLGTGVAPSRSISENAVLKSYRGGPSRGGRSSSGAACTGTRTTSSTATRWPTPGPHLRARDLSGGNLQKLVLGREFAGQAEGADRRLAHARARRRRDRDRPRLPAPGGRTTASPCC